MKKINYFLILVYFSINIITQAKSTLVQTELKEGAIYEINEEIKDIDEYKTKTISFASNDTINYLKYDFSSNMPTSLITSFKLNISPYSDTMSTLKIYCTNLENSATDSDIINAIEEIKNDEMKSTCLHIKQNEGTFDTLMKLNITHSMIVIGIYIPASVEVNARINLRIKEKILDIDESKPNIEEFYSIIPVTIDTQIFRNSDKNVSKILFYSSTHNLYMYESITFNSPIKLFSGNILSVYTNLDMIRQKYHNAKIMTLLPLKTESSQKNNLEESFTFEVTLLDSSFLLDYYVSSSSEGRMVNSPLLINMTECSNPYYVILNYNTQDTKKILILDEIYGKLSFLGIATELTKNTWEEMINYDIQSVNFNEGKYELPANSSKHIDVYKLECTLPIMLNFYYIDDTRDTSKMSEGDIHIYILEKYEEFNVPFLEITSPEIMIEVREPENSPKVQIKVSYFEEKIYTKNTLERFVPINVTDGITIKELGGSSTTRVIIKVGYSVNNWVQRPQNIKYNQEKDIYLFEFPKNAKESFYTFGNLTISGTNSDDNVKFCFTSSIGAALRPSSENCYRVSKLNSYTLRFYNPFIMYKTYEYSKDLKYSITLKPTTTYQNFGAVALMSEYDTNIRNYEGINYNITIHETNKYSSILTPPESNPSNIFLQIQICDNMHSIKTEVIDVLKHEAILKEEEINPGTKNYYRNFSNVLMDTEFYATGEENANFFLRMIGLNSVYIPNINQNPSIRFHNGTNSLIIESPLNTNEDLKITVLIDKENTLVNKKYTLCSFVDNKFENLSIYYKSVTVKNTKKATIHINFKEIGLNSGDKFDALIYFEQLTNSKMIFLSDVYQDIVGKINSIHVINQTEGNYDYASIEEYSDNYYFSYIPEDTLDIPIGSLSVIIDSSTNGDLTGIYCAFVDIDADAETMVDTVEKAIQENKSYCYGSQNGYDNKRYNYIFKYVYENNSPKQMVIKVANEKSVNVKFNIYIKKDQGVEIESTDFTAQKEYGRDENLETTKTVVPYIIDLDKIRGDSSQEYISKILFYSTYLELQLFYISDDNNSPIKLFASNIIFLYTKPELAEQKYHSKILILITENLEGKSHSSLGNTFRFHTKMFDSSAMIEYIVSQNPLGRTLNFPLSLEMNTCTPNNNKLYYILNYNEEEPQRVLHFDMVYGKYSTAKITTSININNWDSLIKSYTMQSITDYRKILPSNSQHLDVIEIECSTPLLINVYYTKNNLFYADVEKGGVAIKLLDAQTSYEFSFKKYEGNDNVLDYSISIFNPVENPDITLTFSDGTQHQIKENSLQTGFLFSIPFKVRITNNGKTQTRFIFKSGYSVELNTDWEQISQADMNGTLYKNNKIWIYKFPLTDNKRNYKTVDFIVNSINDNENTKFCYSTNLGTPIASSRENCFRTGKYIPYTLTFVNPLIIGKDYNITTEKYYVTFTPFDETDGINITVKENEYDTLNRNEIGIAKKLTLSTSDVSTILTMPSQPLDIFFQIQACKSSSFEDSDYIIYNLINAYTDTLMHQGKTNFRDPYGIYYISNLNYMENKITLTRDKAGNDIDIYLKHTPLYNNYSPNINNNYAVTFDETSNALSIIKPILGEQFIITVIIGKEESIKTLTICDLAFTEDKNKFGDYVNTFISTSSDNIIHYIDFSSLNRYEQGTKFYALVFAEQTRNSKMDFLYPYIEGTVGKVSGCIKIEKEIEEGNDEYMTATFEIKRNFGNYLYYDFTSLPKGNVSSFRIYSEIKISKVGCTFVEKDATEEYMQKAVNDAIAKGNSSCIFDQYSTSGELNALVNAHLEENKNRLVIQVLYALTGDNINESKNATINLKTRGTELLNQGEQSNPEKYTIIPYVIPLIEIRESNGTDYVSKILFYSNSNEMEMFYIPGDSPAPKALFSGNILLIYTNKELIRQKYQGAETMILLSKILTTQRDDAIGNIRFLIYYFNSEANIQYFLSSNSEGRPLNIPTAIEMTSCTQPYYYIMNYNKKEGERKMHIDTIYGEKKSIRMATSLNKNTWEELIENMEEISGNEIILETGKYHFDVIEVTCDIPLLINLFYVDPSNIKVNNLEIGDITILSLEKGEEQSLSFIYNGIYFYIYSFTVENEARKPKLTIQFSNSEQLSITDNGVYNKYSINQYSSIKITNDDIGGNSPTRIILKFGYAIEAHFKKDENNIYSNINDINRIYNLYGYIYDQSSTRLSFIGVDFEVSTTEDNVKFCYNTNLGNYIYPSLQNCYRVGKSNPYTISTLNPNVMYRNYKFDEQMNYYIGFRTVNIDQQITIKPVVKNYDTNERNSENTNTVLKIVSDSGEISTILTAPKEHNNYISIEYCLCNKNTHTSYQFYNAYNNTNLGYDGEINNNEPKFITIENTKLDTELKIKGNKDNEIFIKHSGITLTKKRTASVNKIKIEYNKDTKLLTWTQPIIDKNFSYTLFFDKIDRIKYQHYTLCNTTKGSKLGQYMKILTTNNRNPSISIANDTELSKYLGPFDVIIVAEELEDFKITMISDTYDSEGGSDIETDTSDITTDESDKSSDITSDIHSDDTSDIPSDKSDITSDISTDTSDIHSDDTSDIPSDKSDNGATQPDDNDSTTLILAITIPIVAVILISLSVFLFLRFKRKNSVNSNEEIEKLMSIEKGNSNELLKSV